MMADPAQDQPTAADYKNPILAPDDPRLEPPAPQGPEYADEAHIGNRAGDAWIERVACPLCDEEVEVPVSISTEEPCPEHDGEMHEQVVIDMRPLAEHEETCPVFKRLRESFQNPN